MLLNTSGKRRWIISSPPNGGGLQPDEGLHQLADQAVHRHRPFGGDQADALLARLGTGTPDDEALRAVVGRDTNGIDGAVRNAILAEFPSSADASRGLSWGAGQMP